MNYTGSGILLIYLLNNIPYFIIIKDTYNLYGDTGGKLEENLSILKNALKELYEETCGLLYIDIKKINEKNYLKIDIKYKHNSYYQTNIFIIDSKIDFDLYKKNLIKCNKFNFNPFSESIKIKLLPLSKIYIKYIFKQKFNYRFKYILYTIIKKYSSIKKFYEEMKNKITPIYLKKSTTNAQTYEYDTNKKINIKKLSTFVIADNQK